MISTVSPLAREFVSLVVPSSNRVDFSLVRGSCRSFCNSRTGVDFSRTSSPTVCRRQLARHAHRAAPGIGRDVVGVLPVVHPGDHDAPAVRHVVERHTGVEVPAVVQPVGPLGAGLGRSVREGELIGQHMSPTTGVVVDDLDRAFSPFRSRRSQPTQSRFSLSEPVAVRTICPSTTRLTVVSTLRGSAAVGPSTGWSKVRCPHPPVAWSLIRSTASWPR